MKDEDIDYLFEIELENNKMDIQDCISHIKKLHDSSVKGRAKDIFFCMWSSLQTLDLAIYEVKCMRKTMLNVQIRQQICERLLNRLLAGKDGKVLDDIISRVVDEISTEKEKNQAI